MNSRFLVFLVVGIFSLSLSAQKSDFRTWTGISIEGEAFKLIDLEVTPELRLNNNSTTIQCILTDFEISTRITKFFRIGGQYRIQKSFDIEDPDYIVNRFGLVGKIDYKIQRFRFDYRAIYQWEYVGVNTREYGSIPYQEHRHKFAVAYYRKKWDLRPQISAEFFFLNKPEFELAEKKYRLSAGVDYKINKKLSLSIDYKLQHTYLDVNPLTAHIIATKIKFSL